MIGWHTWDRQSPLLRPQNIRNRLDHLVRQVDLTKNRSPIVSRRDRLWPITSRNHERDTTRCQRFRYRHRHSVKEPHVQDCAVDNFLFNESERFRRGPSRANHDCAGLGNQICWHHGDHHLIFNDKDATTAQDATVGVHCCCPTRRIAWSLVRMGVKKRNDEAARPPRVIQALLSPFV